MTICEFYRSQLVLIFNELEPGWSELETYDFGYQWTRQVNSYLETLRIVQLGDTHPFVMYTITLPEDFKQTNIFDMAYQYKSQYELSLLLHHSKLQLSMSKNCSELDESMAGFLFRSRAELFDIIDFSVYG
ncbi:hypothetical protein GK047_27895 [Paenibacillus sp. SYP-B3998]|uniref:Uncharacterized protein n=1 Tax=Paenibacillus sp. SYP-B3998 TaxID=2678564 RepID=A0A6G4A628_9BACL|nr:hypothetical protein [Paenibacillus sp. SYP-B3998]NEW09748.1 hypothetical protein [Paenibacillus sp. SYP-B3998]